MRACVQYLQPRVAAFITVTGLRRASNMRASVFTGESQSCMAVRVDPQAVTYPGGAAGQQLIDKHAQPPDVHAFARAHILQHLRVRAPAS